MHEKLGIVDWGIGGLGVVRELRALSMQKGAILPAISYFSDTGSKPYGMLSATDLEARLRKVISFMRARGARKIFFACNAASTALTSLNDLGDVSGVIAPTLELISNNRKWTRIAIIAGRRTVLSRVYAASLRARGVDVAQRIAQPLSGLIERGQQSSPAFENAVVRILRPVMNYSALILACTHYPAALVSFQRYFVGRVVDPLPAIARSLAKSAAVRTQRFSGGSTLGGGAEFFTTGDPRAMQVAARKAWGDFFSHIGPTHVRM